MGVAIARLRFGSQFEGELLTGRQLFPQLPGDGGELIAPEDLPPEIRAGEAAVRVSGESAAGRGANDVFGEKDFREAKRKFEVAYFERRLGENNWNISRTAAIVGLHRQSLQEKLRELGMQRPGRVAASDDTEE